MYSALLLNGMQESNEKEINLKGHGDLKMSVFKPILDYIYTGEMDMASKDDHLIIAIWVEASFFGLVKLSDKIVKYTYAQAATKNNLLSWAFEMLSIAHVHQNTKLKEKCFVELDKDAEASIKRSNEINKLSGDLLKELIARDTFCVEETLIYEAVNGWISANQPEESVSNLEKQRFGWTKQDLFDEVRIQHIPPEILFNNDKMLASFRDRQIILAMKSNHCTRIQDKRFRGYKGKNLLIFHRNKERPKIIDCFFVSSSPYIWYTHLLQEQCCDRKRIHSFERSSSPVFRTVQLVKFR